MKPETLLKRFPDENLFKIKLFLRQTDILLLKAQIIGEILFQKELELKKLEAKRRLLECLIYKLTAAIDMEEKPVEQELIRAKKDLLEIKKKELDVKIPRVRKTVRFLKEEWDKLKPLDTTGLNIKSIENLQKIFYINKKAFDLVESEVFGADGVLALTADEIENTYRLVFENLPKAKELLLSILGKYANEKA